MRKSLLAALAAVMCLGALGRASAQQEAGPVQPSEGDSAGSQVTLQSVTDEAVIQQYS